MALWLKMLLKPRKFPVRPERQEKIIASLEAIPDPRVIEILIDLAGGKWNPMARATNGLLGFLDSKTALNYPSMIIAVAQALVRRAERGEGTVDAKLRISWDKGWDKNLCMEVASRATDPALCAVFANELYRWSLHPWDWWKDQDRNCGHVWLEHEAAPAYLMGTVDHFKLCQCAWTNVRTVIGGLPHSGPFELLAAINNGFRDELYAKEAGRMIAESDFPKTWTTADRVSYFEAGRAACQLLRHKRMINNTFRDRELENKLVEIFEA